MTRARFIICRLPVLICWTLGALALDIVESLTESIADITREWRAACQEKPSA